VNDVNGYGLADKILASCTLRVNITKRQNDGNAGGILCLFIYSKMNLLSSQLY
jgi:hypothetical protein